MKSQSIALIRLQLSSQSLQVSQLQQVTQFQQAATQEHQVTATS
jgi:hypothetical protein